MLVCFLLKRHFRSLEFKWLPPCVFNDASTRGGGGGGTPLFGLYGDVPLDRVWFLASMS